MKRTELKRNPDAIRAWQNRSAKPLQRKTRIKPYNAKRRRAAYAKNFGVRADRIRSMPCLVRAAGSCSGDPVAAHARARGMGGAKGDRRNLVSLCARHHDEAGELRTSQRAAFEAKYSRELQDLTLMEWADKLAAGFDDEGLP